MRTLNQVEKTGGQKNTHANPHFQRIFRLTIPLRHSLGSERGGLAMTEYAICGGFWGSTQIKIDDLANLRTRSKPGALFFRGSYLPSFIPIFDRQSNLCPIGANFRNIHRMSQYRQGVKFARNLGPEGGADFPNPLR